MIKNSFLSLKQNRDKLRAELENRSPVPAGLHGELMPKMMTQFDQEELFKEGTILWTRISMATLVTVTEALGWEPFINLLDKKQRPANYRRAKELVAKYNISNDPSGAWDLLMVWAIGCLFEGYRGQRSGLKGIKGGGGDMADFCPQVKALSDMGMLRRGSEVQTWCEAYDNLVMHYLNPDMYFTYLECLAKEGEHCCVTYISDAKDAKGDNYYQKVKNLQNDRKAKKDELVPRPYQYSREYWSRLVEKLPLTPVEIAKDGTWVKARIALDNIILAASEMGWEKLINLIIEEHSFGFDHCADDLKAYLGIVGDDLETAGILLGATLFMMGYDDHQFINVSEDYIEGVSQKCKLVDTAKNLGMEDKIDDLSLWCDFYHNFIVHAINPSYQLTHTHCLGRRDKYCRFVLK